jgi:ferrous iron transport protein A
MQTITLDKLPFGQKALIKSFRPEAKPFRRKLLAMGVTTGCEISVVREAPLGDPLEIEMRGYQLCLRRSEAATINVEVAEA